MTSLAGERVLSIVISGAGPASSVAALITQAIERGRTVQAIATPAALAFLDTDAIAPAGAPPRRH